jgi:hypothetical protein
VLHTRRVKCVMHPVIAVMAGWGIEPLEQDRSLVRARLAVGTGVAWDPPEGLDSSCSFPAFVLYFPPFFPPYAAISGLSPGRQ